MMHDERVFDKIITSKILYSTFCINTMNNTIWKIILVENKYIQHDTLQLFHIYVYKSINYLKHIFDQPQHQFVFMKLVKRIRSVPIKTEQQIK